MRRPAILAPTGDEKAPRTVVASGPCSSYCWGRPSLSPPYFPLFSTLALCVACLFGCERFERTKECAALADSVNAVMHSIQEENETGLAPANLRVCAKQYAQLADELGPMEFGERQMALDVAVFRRQLDQAAELTTDLARAKAHNELAEAALIGRELSALQAPMKGSAYKMNTWCQKP